MPELKERSGWITPQGDFIEVPDYKHDQYCHDQGSTTARFESSGHIRCSYDFFDSMLQISDTFEQAGGRYNQKQFDVAFDWCLANECTDCEDFKNLSEGDIR